MATPAKSKLILIKVQQAATPIKDFVTDLLAKYAAETTGFAAASSLHAPMPSSWPTNTIFFSHPTISWSPNSRRHGLPGFAHPLAYRGVTGWRPQACSPFRALPIIVSKAWSGGRKGKKERRV
jgi:hypothetical protein